MTFLEDLHAKRTKFLTGVKDNQDDINLDIFEDFYPDKAHFIYELLQNAEDAHAQHCTFQLFPDKCQFTHDGTRQFCQEDVRAITGIHTSTKRDDSEKIGSFGIGFKAVFAYTRTPCVQSWDYCFRITDFVLPWELERDPTIGKKTRFTLPFDHPETPPAEAYSDIDQGLRKLPAATLLFLRHIKSVT